MRDPRQQGNQEQFEEFTLVDVDASPPSSRNTATDPYSIQTHNDTPMPSRLHRVAFTGLNVLISCSALAIAKQIVNPANYSQTEAAAQEASKQLPEWYAQQYKSRRMASDLWRNILKDTSVLMAASATWYGVQIGLKTVRDKEDAANVCAAGTLSAALLGATFFEPFKWSRTGIWGAVGGIAGYYGFKEQQALRGALLERQQELEQKHMHKGPDDVQTKLSGQLLKKLLEMEQQQQLQHIKHKHEKEIAGSKADAAAGSSENWQHLINSAPWLQQDQQAGGTAAAAAQEQQDESSKY